MALATPPQRDQYGNPIDPNDPWRNGTTIPSQPVHKEGTADPFGANSNGGTTYDVTGQTPPAQPTQPNQPSAGTGSTQTNVVTPPAAPPAGTPTQPSTGAFTAYDAAGHPYQTTGQRGQDGNYLPVPGTFLQGGLVVGPYSQTGGQPPPAPAPQAGPVNGDYQGWFTGLVGDKPWNQQTFNSLLPQLQAAGITPVSANAAGEQTKLRLPDGTIVRVGFGEGHPVWIIQNGASGADNTRTPGAGVVPQQPDYIPYVPPGAPDTSGIGSVLDPSNPTQQTQNALMQHLMGVATGSTPESANPNFNINPNDPIIKGQVDAASAQSQLAQRNYLAQLAEQKGSNANIGAETRAAAEQGGQQVSALQAQLMQQELTARRGEVQQALQLAVSQGNTQQQVALQEELKKLDLAQQQFQFQASQSLQSNALQNELQQQAYQFNAQLGQNAYQFDVNDQFRNSPLGS